MVELLGLAVVVGVVAGLFVVWPAWVYRDVRRRDSDHPYLWACMAFLGSLTSWVLFAAFYLWYRRRIGERQESQPQRPDGMGDRAQSIGIARLFLSLGVGAIMIWIIGKVTSPILTEASEDAPAGSVYVDGNEYVTQAVQPETLVVAVLVVSVFGLVAYSVFSRGLAR